MSTPLRTLGIEEVTLLLQATFKIFDSAKKASDPYNCNAEVQFVTLFIQTLVSRALSIKPPAGLSRDKQEESIRNSYGRVKLGIQEAAALGFETAMKNYGNQDVEFACTIKPVPQGKSALSH